MQAARLAAGPATTIGLVAWKEQNLLMLTGPKTEFGFTRSWRQQDASAYAWLAADPAHRRLFAPQQAMGTCINRQLATRLGRANRQTWWLFGEDAIVPGCTPPDGYTSL